MFTEGHAAALPTKLEYFADATSLGGVESLVCHPASMTHASIPRELREARGLSDTLLRISVGIEDAEDLLEDLDQALAHAAHKSTFFSLAGQH